MYHDKFESKMRGEDEFSEAFQNQLVNQSQEPNTATSETVAVEATNLVASVKPHKIFCFNNGGEHGWMHAVAIADDGHCLAQHVCSHEGFMAHDLGITSNCKHENYNKHFGEGNWELEWVNDVKGHAGLTAAYALNQKLAALKAEAANTSVSDGTTQQQR